MNKNSEKEDYFYIEVKKTEKNDQNLDKIKKFLETSLVYLLNFQMRLKSIPLKLKLKEKNLVFQTYKKNSFL
jgi:hypothetical protein